MALADRWLLPDGVKEVLPPQARQVETLRRRLLDLYDNWGYEQVMPPLMEHLDSLLTGVGKDLDLITYKLVDQQSGRTLGLRADITPQVARIDAHRMTRQSANRLCYCGSILHAEAENMLASRNPLQIGAEIYGHAGIESDVEVISLMLETMLACGIEQELSLDLGHVDVFRGVMKLAGLTESQEHRYQELVLTKAFPDLVVMMASIDIDEELRTLLLELPKLNGGIGVLARAEGVLSKAPESVKQAISYLKALSKQLEIRYPEVDQYFDLSELRGFNYHTGVVFAALTPQFGQAIAKGGRYDSIGKDFGRSRPATGFSSDLKTLSDMSSAVAAKSGVLAPAGCETLLLQKISELRSLGIRVVQKLPGDDHEAEMHYDQQLVQQGDNWVVEPC